MWSKSFGLFTSSLWGHSCFTTIIHHHHHHHQKLLGGIGCVYLLWFPSNSAFFFLSIFTFLYVVVAKKQQHYFGIYFCFDSKSRKYFILVFVRPFVWQCKYDIIPGRYVVGMFVVFFFVLAFVLIKQIKVMFTVLCLSQPKRHGHRPLSV